MSKFLFKTKPYAHQLECLEACHDKKNFAIFAEMGCGKSKILIDNIVWLYQQGEIDTVVIVAPKGVYINWVRSELPRHMPDEIDYEVYTWRTNPNKTEGAKLVEGITARDKLRILVVNVEGFATKKLPSYCELFTKNSKAMIAVDESTSIKNPKAKRTKALVRIGAVASYKRILTGSPVTQSPLDLYAQCFFLDRKLLGFDSFYSFQNHYAILKRQNFGSGYSFQQVVGYRNLEELSDRLSMFSYRIRKEDALDLPAKTYAVREVELTPEQALAYRSMESAALLLLNGDDLVTAPEALTQLLRLQQIICGYVKTDDGELREVSSNRLNTLMDILEETSGSVIIWSRFRHDIEAIQNAIAKAYGRDSVVTYYGGTSDVDRIAAVERFENREARFFVGNPQTAGMGLTLVAASTVVYYANDFNLESRIQSEDRCHRIGQNNPVLYIDLVSKGSVREHIVKILQNKLDLSAKTLGESVKSWLKLV